jgi:hypothetical protein
MTTNLVELIIKPGIQRDGTPFQGDYCTDGQWIRFQRGKIRKMGGQLGALHNLNTFVSDLHVEPFNVGNQMVAYLGAVDGIYKLVLTTDMNQVVPPVQILALVGQPETEWISEALIWSPPAGAPPAVGVPPPASQPNRYIAFLKTNTNANLTDTSAGALYYTEITPLFSNTTTQVADLPQDINGGICFAAPYLFGFGTKGQVYYSRNNNPFNFTAVDHTADPTNTGSDGGQLQISNDKVIYGAQIRGGSNSPAVLFWTLSSVVRITNVSSTNAGNPEFKIDAISKSSSILSQKCVVEYDGLFFWPGNDRFFVYNGVVQEMVNFTNLNYFFDNIDPIYRSRIFGFKNTRYGEIWWCYPERGSNGVCTHAIIYNKRENSWYDTALQNAGFSGKGRTAGTFFEAYGMTFTYGDQLTAPTANQKCIWQHEVIANEATDLIATQGRKTITSSFTTPVFGWASFNPAYTAYGRKSQAVDRFIQLSRLEPDFVIYYLAAGGSSINMDFQILGATYAQDQSDIVLLFTGPFTAGRTANPSLGKIDVLAQARYFQLKFITTASSGVYEMGNIFMLVGIGDGQ